jgi:hypothetical protein
MQEAQLSDDDNKRFFSHNQNSIDNNIDKRYQTSGETSPKRTSPIHEFIKFYRPIIQEHREFQEIASYLDDHFFSPIHPQLTPADNGIYNLSVNNITGSNNIPSTNPPVGYRSFTCAQCLTGLVDAVLLSEYERIGPASFNVEHTCKQEDLQKFKHTSERNYIDMTRRNELQEKVTKYLADIIHQWVGLDKDVYLSSIEVPTHIFRSEYSKEKNNNKNISDKVEEIKSKYSKPWIEGSYIKLGMLDNNHWAYRALNENEDKGTATDNNELLDFLNHAKSTLAPFQAEVGGRLRNFYIFISSK